MAEEEEEQDAIPEPKPSSQPGRYLVLILLILVAEAGVGYVLLDRVIPAPEELPQEEDEVQEKMEVKDPIYYTQMLDMIVNPISPTGSHLVRFGFALEVSSESTLEEIGIRHDVLWDLLLQNLESLNIQDIRDPEKKRLKGMVMKVLNAELKNGDVTGVYVTDIVVQ